MIHFPDITELDEGASSEPGVHYYYEDIDFEIANGEKLAVWITQTAVAEGLDFHNTSYIFCSDEYLYEINMEYLNHDDYTDVITFPYADNRVEGDVFISIERIRENAQQLGVTFEAELHRVMVHGALHLCGHTDKSTEQRAAMTEKENFYLQKLNLS